MNGYEQRIRNKMLWALRRRNALSDVIFDEGRNPTPEEWEIIQGYNKIIKNCSVLLVKFFAPKSYPENQHEDVLYV